MTHSKECQRKDPVKGRMALHEDPCTAFATRRDSLEVENRSTEEQWGRSDTPECDGDRLGNIVVRSLAFDDSYPVEVVNPVRHRHHGMEGWCHEAECFNDHAYHVEIIMREC